MKEMFVPLLIGIIAGTVDVLPMIKMNLDKYSICSAFIFYLILPYVIFHTTLFERVWWINGGIIGLALALPVIILVTGTQKGAAFPMAIMSAVLGAIIGIAGHFIMKA